MVSATNAVSRLFESASEDMENPAFAASINLEKIRAANMTLDIEIEKLMEEYEKLASEVRESKRRLPGSVPTCAVCFTRPVLHRNSLSHHLLHSRKLT